MITRDVLEAQRALYQQGQMRMLEGLEKAKADAAAMSGAIDACESLLQLLDGMEEAQAADDAAAKKKPKRKKKK